MSLTRRQLKFIAAMYMPELMKEVWRTREYRDVLQQCIELANTLVERDEYVEGNLRNVLIEINNACYCTLYPED